MKQFLYSQQRQINSGFHLTRITIFFLFMSLPCFLPNFTCQMKTVNIFTGRRKKSRNLIILISSEQNNLMKIHFLHPIKMLIFTPSNFCFFASQHSHSVKQSYTYKQVENGIHEKSFVEICFAVIWRFRFREEMKIKAGLIREKTRFPLQL